MEIQKQTIDLFGLFIYNAALHRSGAYKHLMNEEDFDNLKWLQVFK